MSEIGFEVLGAAAEPHAAVPTMAFTLRIAQPGAVIHSLALQCQIRIEPQRRRYTAAEENGLRELFGDVPRWGDTLKPFLWTHVSRVVTGFTDATQIELHVPCSYDLDVAAAKYLHALADGEIPLLFLFSGAVFTRGETGMQVAQVPWHRDAAYRLPVRVWRETMNLYFPNSGWLRLQRETLDALTRFKAARALATWDETLGALLAQADGARP